MSDPSGEREGGPSPSDDTPKKEEKKGKAKRNPKGPLDDRTVPFFAEKCDFCESYWISNIEFQNVVVKGYKAIHRACQFCIVVMQNGPAPTPSPSI